LKRKTLRFARIFVADLQIATTEGQKLFSPSKNWETRGAFPPNLSYLSALSIKFLCVAPSAETCSQVCPHWQLLLTYPPKRVYPAKIRLPMMTQWDILVRFRREDTLLSLLSSDGLWSSLGTNCSPKAKETQLPQPPERKSVAFP